MRLPLIGTDATAVAVVVCAEKFRQIPDGGFERGPVAVVGADPDNYERSKGAGEWPSQIWRDACSG